MVPEVGRIEYEIVLLVSVVVLNSTLCQWLKGEGAIGTEMIDVVRAMLPPAMSSGKQVTPADMVHYAVIQPEFGGIIGRNGIFCLMRGGKPTVAITTKILDYGTGRRCLLRRYSPREMAELTPYLEAFGGRYRQETGQETPFLLFFSESFRDAAIEITVAKGAGKGDSYGIQSYGRIVVATDDIRGTTYAIASELFPGQVGDGSETDMDSLLPDKGTIY